MKLFYTLRYTRFSQLAARIGLLLKRKFPELFCRFYNHRFERRKVIFKVVDRPSKPVFKSRKGLFSELSRDPKAFSLTFLNRTRIYQTPINWHEKELESGTRLWKLNLHYQEFLEEADSEWFRWVVSDWIQQNPPYKKRYWLDSWNSFALSIRVVVWMQQIAQRKDRLDENFIREAAESVYKQILFLEKNLEKDVTGNHLIKNLKALLWGSSFFVEDINTRRWHLLGCKLLDGALNEQILEDGMHYERSPSYHCQVLADLLECYTVLEKSSLKTRLKNKLLKMGEALTSLVHPDQKISLFNDGGLNMSYSPGELTAALQEQLNFIPQKNESIVLDHAGYFGLHKNNSYLLFDAGKIAPDHLPAHGHGDIFSFEWSIEDERIFVDKGVYEYSKGDKREQSRSTKSHNTVTIADEDQCEFWSSFRVARRAEVQVHEYHFENGVFTICAEHDGYRRLKNQPVHRRSLTFDGTELQIADTIEKGSGLDAKAHFLLAPAVGVIQQNKRQCLLTTGKRKLVFKSESPVKIIRSSWYPDFGVEQTCNQIIVYLGKAPCRVIHHIKMIS